MSVNARFALAMLALGHDQRRTASRAPAASTQGPATTSVRKQDGTGAVIADLAASWLGRKVPPPRKRE